MKLIFRGGGMWDGVEINSAHAPQEIRLSGVTFHDNEHDDAVPPSMRKTVLMSKIENQRYELDSFEGKGEDTAIYVLVQK